MSADVISSSPASSTEMSSPALCIKFLPVEFTIFLLVFLAGLISNVLFLSVTFKKPVSAKGAFQKPSVYLIHWSIANLILLAFNMPFDVISFAAASRSWLFGDVFCRLHFFIERGMYFSIATHLMYMICEAYHPFGFPRRPRQMVTNWGMSLVFMCPLLFTPLVYTKGGCTHCSLEKNNLADMAIFKWTEELYVAVLPLVTIGCYINKHGGHPDYENQAKEGPDDVTGTPKMKLRPMCIILALSLLICTSPARFIEMARGDSKSYPGYVNQVIYFFAPRLLIYGQTIVFTMVCARFYPSLYQEAKIAAARPWGYRRLPDKFLELTAQDEEKKELKP